MGKFREHTIQEKRKLRNARQKRKRKQRAIERKSLEARNSQKVYEDRLRKEAKLPESLRKDCQKWKQTCAENAKLKERLKQTTLRPQHVDRNAKEVHVLASSSKYSSVNLIDQSELLVIDGKTIVLGQGSYGRCLLKNFHRLGIRIVEKQSLVHEKKELLREAHIMQTLSHKNIPAIIGVQLEKEPISLIIEFKGENDTSITVSKLMSSDGSNSIVQSVKNSITKEQWLIISHDFADALAYLHSKCFLHCDLKSNNVLVSNKRGFVIDFGKACEISFPRAKKYTTFYPHIAPEVLKGYPCSKASDIFSLGKIFEVIGVKQDITLLNSTAQKCLDASPARRPTTTGIMATLAPAISC